VSLLHTPMFNSYYLIFYLHTGHMCTLTSSRINYTLTQYLPPTGACDPHGSYCRRCVGHRCYIKSCAAGAEGVNGSKVKQKVADGDLALWKEILRGNRGTSCHTCVGVTAQSHMFAHAIFVLFCTDCADCVHVYNNSQSAQSKCYCTSKALRFALEPEGSP
jgi:hypothetical protein